MKSVRAFAIVLALISGLSAQAIFDPNWERPILKADLIEILSHEPFRFPVAKKLTLHQRDGVAKPTLFSLVEDTGVRCVTTPCPSIKTSLFEITKSQRIVGAEGIVYYAKELPVIQKSGAIYNGLRKLVVTQRVTAAHEPKWNVRVTDSKGNRSYFGQAEGIPTIESLDGDF